MKYLMFICLLLAVMQTPQAQCVGTPYIGFVQKPAPPSSTMGVDFWMTFENNFGQVITGGNTYLALNIAAQLPTTITISFTESGNSYTYTLAAGVSRRIDIRQMVSDGNTGTVDERAGVYIDTATAKNGGVSNKTMHITSTQPIAVYAFDTQSATTDATVVYPTVAWGTDYYQLAYAPSNGFVSNEIIIANQDNTIITLSDNTTQTLSAGQVYVTNGGTADLTGRHLTSSKPVACFAGATIFNVPATIGYADVMCEQMVPTKMWDKRYFVPNVPQFSNSSLIINNRIRIVASQDGTNITYSGASLPAITPTGSTAIANGEALNAGQWVELVINDRDSGAYITANNPVGIAGYLVGGSSAGGIAIGKSGGGDPDGAMIPGLNQLIQQVTISPFMFPIYSTTQTGAAYTAANIPYTNFDDSGAIHGAIILTKTAYKNSVNMVENGTVTLTLDPDQWIDDANGSGMSIYRYQFDNINDQNSSFTISSLVNGGGLVVLCYGIATVESYYYNAGSGAYSLQ